MTWLEEDVWLLWTCYKGRDWENVCFDDPVDDVENPESKTGTEDHTHLQYVRCKTCPRDHTTVKHAEEVVGGTWRGCEGGGCGGGIWGRGLHQGFSPCLREARREAFRLGTGALAKERWRAGEIYININE